MLLSTLFLCGPFKDSYTRQGWNMKTPYSSTT